MSVLLVSLILSKYVHTSKACVATKNQIFHKAKGYEVGLEDYTATLFGDACQETVHKYHSCVATLNWNKEANKLHQYQDITESIDEGARLCFINYHFNMKVGDSGTYHYDIKKGGVFPVGSACTADDRRQILENYIFIYLNETLRFTPDMHVSNAHHSH